MRRGECRSGAAQGRRSARHGRRQGGSARATCPRAAPALALRRRLRAGARAVGRGPGRRARPARRRRCGGRVRRGQYGARRELQRRARPAYGRSGARRRGAARRPSTSGEERRRRRRRIRGRPPSAPRRRRRYCDRAPARTRGRASPTVGVLWQHARVVCAAAPREVIGVNGVRAGPLIASASNPHLQRGGADATCSSVAAHRRGGAARSWSRTATAAREPMPPPTRAKRARAVATDVEGHRPSRRSPVRANRRSARRRRAHRDERAGARRARARRPERARSRARAARRARQVARARCGVFARERAELRPRGAPRAPPLRAAAAAAAERRAAARGCEDARGRALRPTSGVGARGPARRARVPARQATP